MSRDRSARGVPCRRPAPRPSCGVAQRLADRLRQLVARVPSSHNGKPRELTRGAKMSRGKGMRGCGIVAWRSTSLHRIGDDLGDRRLVIGKAIDEGRVGAVLEQAAHQIGEQVLVAADRRIDAAGLVHLRIAPTTCS